MRYFTLLVSSIIISLSLIPNGVVTGEFIVTHSYLSVGRNRMAVYGQIENVGHRTHYVPSVSVNFYVNNNLYASSTGYCDAAVLRPLDTCNFNVEVDEAPQTGQVTYATNINSILQA
jgi:hypothetical protein